MMIQPLTPLYSLNELAALLKISARTLESLILTGAAPPHVRIGRQRRWVHTDVVCWLEKKRCDGTEDLENSGFSAREAVTQMTN